jgi:hypothetical protein
MSHRSLVRSTIAFALVIGPFHVVSAAHRLASVTDGFGRFTIHNLASGTSGLAAGHRVVADGALFLQFAETQ